MDGDPIAAFQAAMAERGIVLRGAPVPDGRLHRFDVDGDPKGSKNGYYKLHIDGRPAGVYGCWKRGIKGTWKANGKPLSDFDHAELMREIRAEQRRRDERQARKQKEAAEDAAELWGGYQPAPTDHPYLVRKRVQSHGARVDGAGRLVLTVADADGKIWSLQTIDADGGKLFMSGGRKRGCLFLIGEPRDRVIIAEGFATGASIHEATGVPVAVAFDAGNLEPVARAIRTKWPAVQIVIAADDDNETDGNPGLAAARKAAEAVGACVAVPSRAVPDSCKLDFNDLAIAEGGEAVAAIILAAFPEPEPEPEPEAEPSAQDATSEPAPEDDWAAVLEAEVVALNERYFVAAMGGSVRIARTVHDEDLGRDRLVFMRDSDLRLRFSHRHLKVGETQRGFDIVKGLGDAWLNHHLRRTYDRIALIPSGHCPPEVYNLWRGFGVEPKAGRWPTIRAHLHDIVCSDRQDYFDWLVRWMGRCVQKPGIQAETAIGLRGLKGTGKGLVGQMLARIFRDHTLHITNSKHLVGNFNAHLVDALFLFLDEAYWGGDKQGEGVLKGLITERTLMIEPKGVDSFQMPNRLKILMCSNNDWIVPATSDERRYFVLDVPDTRKGDKAYFTALAGAIDGDELAAFLDYLLKLDLSGFDHRNPPHTSGLNKQKLVGADSVEKFWMDCLTTGVIVNAEIGDEWPEAVRCADLHNAYIEHAHALGDRHPLSAERFAIRLRDLCPGGYLKVIRPKAEESGHGRPRLYALHALDLHRAAFLKAMTIAAYDWPQVESGS